MLGYARDEVFTADQILARMAAVACVRKVTEREPRIRCHELARAVLARFDSIGKIGPGKWFIADGKCGAVDHSWLYDSSGSGDILDVYCPGREPMVQLIDRFCSFGLYVPAGALRTDIDSALVHALVTEMRTGHTFIPPKRGGWPYVGESWTAPFGKVHIVAVTSGSVMFRQDCDGTVDRVTLPQFLEVFERVE